MLGLVWSIPKRTLERINISSPERGEKFLYGGIRRSGDQNAAVDVDCRLGDLIGAEHPKGGIPGDACTKAIQLNFVQHRSLIHESKGSSSGRQGSRKLEGVVMREDP